MSIFGSIASIFILPSSNFVCLMFSVGSKKILFMASAVSPPVEPAPVAINVMFAIQAGHIGFLGSFCLRRILFKLWQHGIHLVPRVRV